MTQFDVSRPTLREAIRLLEAEGLVRVLRGAKGGVRICPPQEDSAARTLGFLLQFRGATLAEVLDARSFIRSEEHTSELQSLMRISYAVFCLKKKTNTKPKQTQR